MKAFSYVRDIISFPFTIGPEIGYGAQGQVFEIVEDPTRVIKFSILYDVKFGSSLEFIFNKIKTIYNFIKNNPHDNVVRIFEFGELLSSSRVTVDGDQKFIVYYSIQEKLQTLSIDEKKVFKTVCDYHNGDLDCERALKQLLLEQAEWLDFDCEKVLSFYDSIHKYPIDNCDFRRRNIMKDTLSFKLIDFDLSEIKEI